MSQPKYCFGFEFVLKCGSSLANAPAHGAQNRSCFGVEFVLKWRFLSRMPQPMALRTGPLLVLNVFSTDTSLLTNAPAHGAQIRCCFVAECILKWRLPSDKCPSMTLKTGLVHVLNAFCNGASLQGRDQVWPKLCAKFGQTKFGQDQVWPDQVWPRPNLAKCSQNRFGRSQRSTSNKMLNFEGKLGKREKQEK